MHFLGERDDCANKQQLSQLLKRESFLKPEWDLYKTLPKKKPDFQEQDLLDLTEPSQNSSN